MSLRCASIMCQEVGSRQAAELLQNFCLLMNAKICFRRLHNEADVPYARPSSSPPAAATPADCCLLPAPCWMLQVEVACGPSIWSFVFWQRVEFCSQLPSHLGLAYKSLNLARNLFAKHLLLERINLPGVCVMYNLCECVCVQIQVKGIIKWHRSAGGHVSVCVCVWHMRRMSNAHFTLQLAKPFQLALFMLIHNINKLNGIFVMCLCECVCDMQMYKIPPNTHKKHICMYMYMYI